MAKAIFAKATFSQVTFAKSTCANPGFAEAKLAKAKLVKAKWSKAKLMNLNHANCQLGSCWDHFVWCVVIMGAISFAWSMSEIQTRCYLKTSNVKAPVDSESCSVIIGKLCECSIYIHI